jgi:hypothetical protein
VNPASNACAATALADAEDHLDKRELSESLRAFEVAATLGADPDRCSAGRWMAHMLLGDFASAWLQSDAIRRRGAFDPHRFLNDQDIAGKRVIVRCLHGFGDAVQLLRYAPKLQAAAQHVTYEVPPRLLELSRFFRGVGNVVTWGEQAPQVEPAWDVQVEIMELPYLFRTEVKDLPIAENYLNLPRSSSERVGQSLGAANALRVGIVWSAGEWNPARSVPFEHVAHLVANSRCEFWNLQGGGAATDAGPDLLQIFPGCQDSIVALSCLISQLDLVITVDSLAAHLAGALGVPAWVLLQHAADWRWMTGRVSSPWYPSLRLFRQRTPGDWHSVVTAVQQALRDQSRQHSRG